MSVLYCSNYIVRRRKYKRHASYILGIPRVIQKTFKMRPQVIPLPYKFASHVMARGTASRLSPSRTLRCNRTQTTINGVTFQCIETYGTLAGSGNQRLKLYDLNKDQKEWKKLEINILWSNPAERNQRICWDPMSPLCETIQFYRRLLKNSSEMETGKSLLFSKDCCLNKTNYGPLSILPSLSEVFKTLVDSKSALILKTFSTNMCLHIGNPMDLTPPPSASRSSRKTSWRITMLSALYQWPHLRRLTLCHVT